MAPVRRYWDAVTSANRKPLQAAVRSNATALLAPRAAWTRGAEPKRSSGVEVASSTRSSVSADQPAISRAEVPALAARSVRLSWGLLTRRLPIPVRVRIHSSLVSTRRPSWSLLITCSAWALPQPIRATPRECGDAPAKRRSKRWRQSITVQKGNLWIGGNAQAFEATCAPS